MTHLRTTALAASLSLFAFLAASLAPSMAQEKPKAEQEKPKAEQEKPKAETQEKPEAKPQEKAEPKKKSETKPQEKSKAEPKKKSETKPQEKSKAEAEKKSEAKPEEEPEADEEMPLVYGADFSERPVAGWLYTDPNAWKISLVDGNSVLDQHTRSDYEPEVRSPYNIALIQGLDLTDFVMDLKVRSTTRDYGHRDLCLFFGHQDPSHFYYIHLGKEADPHAHSVFLVDGEPRVSIAEDRTDGTPWTDGWHQVRLVRKVEDGLIQVFFDDMEEPVMTAHDKTFTHGGIGVGSFDDTGQFDDIRIRGVRHTPAD